MNGHVILHDPSTRDIGKKIVNALYTSHHFFLTFACLCRITSKKYSSAVDTSLLNEFVDRLRCVGTVWHWRLISGRTFAESDVVLTTDWWEAAAPSATATFGADVEEKDLPRSTCVNHNNVVIYRDLTTARTKSEEMWLYLNCRNIFLHNKIKKKKQFHYMCNTFQSVLSRSSS